MFVNVKNTSNQVMPLNQNLKKVSTKSTKDILKPKSSHGAAKTGKPSKDIPKNPKVKVPLKLVVNEDSKKEHKEDLKTLDENIEINCQDETEELKAKIVKKEISNTFTLENSSSKTKKEKGKKNLSKEKNIQSAFDSNITSLNLENYLTNISLGKNKIPNDQYREFFTQLVKEDYSSNILDSLLEDEECHSDFLSAHTITPRMYTRMIDWMIEVLTNYHCDQSTFFEGVNLMVRYFKAAGEKGKHFVPEELHLIGVTSMFLASKYQDIYPLRLRIVHEKIAHKKLSCSEIINKEQDLARHLNYNIGLPTMWDFINLYIEEIFFVRENGFHITNKVLIEKYDLLSKEEENLVDTEEDKKLKEITTKLYTKNMLNLLNHVCLYLAKMNCHDYNLIQRKPSLLAASTLYVAVKICEQINKEDYINDYFNEKLIALSHKDENDIIKTAQDILYNAQNFDTIFSGLQNLKQVHFNAIIELKVTK
ncbi:MAG: hypothetical protein MJ252_17995 [archaeon]|nr:hypothetical protein [archaeon]